MQGAHLIGAAYPYRAKCAIDEHLVMKDRHSMEQKVLIIQGVAQCCLVKLRSYVCNLSI